MKPSQIFEILDIARAVRKSDGMFNPLFVGPPGVGKSHIVQQWAKARNLPFIDLRMAYLEAPDAIGYPSVETVNNRQVTVHNTPEFWPSDGEGVLLLEEPNRGTTSIMNTMMQILTDRKVHKYTLPKGWIIVGCINPEGSEYDVNTMDAALKNRFQIFNINYDKKSFLDYTKKNTWDKSIIHFIESNTWSFKTPDEIGDAPGNKYNSPRTFAALNDVLRSGHTFNQEIELMLYQTILGNNVGKDFYQFRHNESPVVYSDIVDDFKSAAAKLKKFSDPANLKSAMISITIQDIVDDGTIKDDLLVKLLNVLPVDMGVVLIKELEFKRKDNKLLLRLCKDHPEIQKMFKSVLKKSE